MPIHVNVRDVLQRLNLLQIHCVAKTGPSIPGSNFAKNITDFQNYFTAKKLVKILNIILQHGSCDKKK